MAFWVVWPSFSSREYTLLARVLRREAVFKGWSAVISLEAASEEAASLDAASLEAASEEAASLEAASLDAASLDAASEEAVSLEAASLDAASLEAASLEAASLDAASEEAASLEAASLEAASLEAASLDAASEEAASLEAASTKASVEACSGTGWASGSTSACTAVLAASADASAKAAVGSTLNATADASASAVMRCVTLRIVSLLFFNFKFSAYTQISLIIRPGCPNWQIRARQRGRQGQKAKPQRPKALQKSRRNHAGALALPMQKNVGSPILAAWLNCDEFVYKTKKSITKKYRKHNTKAEIRYFESYFPKEYF